MGENIVKAEDWRRERQRSEEILSYVRVRVHEFERMTTLKGRDAELSELVVERTKKQIEKIEREIEDLKRQEKSRTQKVIYTYSNCAYYTHKFRTSLKGKLMKQAYGKLSLTTEALEFQGGKHIWIAINNLRTKIPLDAIINIELQREPVGLWELRENKCVQVTYQEDGVKVIYLSPAEWKNLFSSVTNLYNALVGAWKDHQEYCKLRFVAWRATTTQLRYIKQDIDSIIQRFLEINDESSPTPVPMLPVSPEDYKASDKTSLGIPDHLYSSLRRVLINCTSFRSQQELKAIFVDTRLSLWRGQVPDSESTEGRVNLLIDLLVNRYNANGENGLFLFLQVLAGQLDPHDALYHELLDLANELEKTMRKDKHIQQ